MTTLGSTDAGAALDLDLDRLIGSHACIVANSGGGKSGLIRRLLETTHGRVQHVVLDIEDEFYTLRERFDYVIAGGDGRDTPAEVENAEDLALAALRHGFSLIVQLNDLGPAAPDFVGRFLQAMIGAPRALWRPVLVVLDEAQRFAPQDGSTAATSGVKALTGQGRKRGFTAILASQRIAKIDADVRGDVNNWMLGRVGQALDRRTMADALGFPPSSIEARGLQGLADRTFWGFGPAIAREPLLFRVSDVATTPVRPGQAKVPTPPPPEALREILAGIAATAIEQRETKAVAAYEAGAEVGQLLVEKDARIAELENDVADLRGLEERYAAHIRNARDNLAALALQAEWYREEHPQGGFLSDGRHPLLGQSTTLADTNTAERKRAPTPPPSSAAGGEGEEAGEASRPAASPELPASPSEGAASPDTEYKALAVLAASPIALTEPAWATRAGYSRKGGAWQRRRKRYLQAGLIAQEGRKWFATEAGFAVAGAELPKVPAPGPDLVAYWAKRLGNAPGRILTRLADLYPEALKRGAIADEVRMAEKGGAFQRAVAALKTAELLEERGKRLRVAPAIMGDET